MKGRLYSHGRLLGYQRSRHSQTPSASLMKIKGVNSKEETDFYLGKRVAFIYKGKQTRKVYGSGKSRVKVHWGRISRPHGSNGVVRVRFRNNLPPSSFGKTVRVMLYPSRI